MNGVQAAHRVLVLGTRGDHDHRQVARGRAPAYLAANLDAGHHRQHPVQQDQIGRRFRNASQRFLAVGGFIDPESLFFEVVAQHGCQGCFILDHQHQRL